MILPARISTTSVPSSIRSTFVSTPIVRCPSGSTSRASFKPSEFAKSVFAAVTANMMALGFCICFNTISLICLSISLGWSPTGTFVRPGRSTSVRVRTLGEYIRRLIGAGDMPAFLPVFRSVSLTISSLILLKSKNFCPGMCKNSPHSSTFASLSEVASTPLTPFACSCEGGARLMSCRMSGRLVTMPVPRGRLQPQYQYQLQSLMHMSYKSLPTIFSSTELFPLDCDPTTAICGRSMGFWTCGGGIVSLGRSEGNPCLIFTHSNSCEDILQLVDKGNELGVIDADPG